MSPETLASHRQNRGNPAPEVLRRLRAQPEVLDAATVVGRWIWATFPDRPPQAVITFLQAEGFRWNPTRRAWQHAGGHPTRNATYDPRTKYGEVRATSLMEEAV